MADILPAQLLHGRVKLRSPHRLQVRVPEFVYVSAQEVVRAALAAVEKGRALAIPGFIMELGMTLVCLTPMPILRLVSRFTAKRS